MARGSILKPGETSIVYATAVAIGSNLLTPRRLFHSVLEGDTCYNVLNKAYGQRNWAIITVLRKPLHENAEIKFPMSRTTKRKFLHQG